jgi:hypothetical protein
MYSTTNLSHNLPIQFKGAIPDSKKACSSVVSVSGLMRITDFPVQTPHLDRMLADGDEFFANGVSCVAGPEGNGRQHR